jgi:hypothetical protein
MVKYDAAKLERFMDLSLRGLFFVPGTAGLFMFVAGLGEHQGLRRMALASLLFALTPLLFLVRRGRLKN